LRKQKKQFACKDAENENLTIEGFVNAIFHHEEHEEKKSKDQEFYFVAFVVALLFCDFIREENLP
jgi:hypothetical protein